MSRLKVSIPDNEIGNWKIKKYHGNVHNILTNHTTITDLRYIENEPIDDYTLLNHSQYGCIMMDSEKEYKEHNLLWENLNGKILIGGLGIGMVNEKLITSNDVTKVTIVEKHQEVIDMVWPYCKKDNRFEIIHEDVETWNIPSEYYWNYAWFDTWIGGVSGDIFEYCNMLLQKYSPYCDKIDFWPNLKGK
jgi:hypothetical protein